MKLIKYFNKIIDFKDSEENFKIEPLKYETSDKDFDYWLDVIKKSYGMHGDVTFEDIEEVKTITKEEAFSKTLNELTIENKKKDVIIQQLAKTVNELNIKVMGGVSNV